MAMSKHLRSPFCDCGEPIVGTMQKGEVDRCLGCNRPFDPSVPMTAALAVIGALITTIVVIACAVWF
jgi:hypothetical protein